MAEGNWPPLGSTRGTSYHPLSHWCPEHHLQLQIQKLQVDEGQIRVIACSRFEEG